jgi:ATP-dependent DNA helicase RecG
MLAHIEPHCPLELIREDLRRYPALSSADVNRRIGVEISIKTLKRVLDQLVTTGQVIYTGERRSRRYRLADSDA